MGSEFDETDSPFEAKIDQLLSSALSDQAREQRVLLDTVNGAREALDKAEEQLKALRQLIDNRDQAVVDLLEARLSGLSTEESLERVMSRVDDLAGRPTAEDSIRPLLEGLDRLATRLSSIEELSNERSSLEAASIVARIDVIQAQIAQRFSMVEESVAGDVDTAQDAVTEHFSTELRNLDSRAVDRHSEITQEITQRGVETQEFMTVSITDIRAGVESVLAEILSQSERQAGGLVEIREDLLDTRRDLATTSEGQLRATAEQVSSLRLAVAEAQERLAEAIDTGSAADAERATSERADLRDRLADAYQGLNESISAEMLSHKNLLADLRESLVGLTEASSARTFDRLQQLSGQLDEAQTSLLAVPAGLADLAEIVHRAADDLAPRLGAHLEQERARNEQHAADLLHQIAGLKGAIFETVESLPGRIDSHLDEGRTKDEMRNEAIVAQLYQVTGLISETVTELPLRIDSHLDEGRTKDEMRNQAILAQLDQVTTVIRETVADLPPRIDSHLEEGRSRDEVRNQAILAQLDHVTGLISETVTELPLRIDSHLDEGRTKDEMRNQAILAQLDQVTNVIRETVADLPPMVGAHLEEGRARDEVRNQLVTGYVEEMSNIVQAAMNELPERIENKMQEAAVSGEARNFEVVAQVGDIRNAITAEQPKITEAITDGLRPFAEELQSLGERLRQSNRRITESNSRMEAMHESLISYLTERDIHLERVRDETLNELIQHLVSDLKNRDRVRIGAAMKEADRRRKDKRDAERWRKSGHESGDREQVEVGFEASKTAPTMEPVLDVPEELSPVLEETEPPVLLEPKPKRAPRPRKPLDVVPVPQVKKKTAPKAKPPTKPKAQKTKATPQKTAAAKKASGKPSGGL